MDILYYWNKFCNLFLKKFLFRLMLFFKKYWIQKKDKTKCTYIIQNNWKIFPITFNQCQECNFNDNLRNIAKIYTWHYFDLLGSGWRNYKLKCGSRKVKGAQKICDESMITNSSNKDYASHIKQYIDKNYEIIDWQYDTVSGYRWNENIWYLNIPIGHLPKVDIKVPWELSRMQHLILFSRTYGNSGNGKYITEFRNEVLDFIAHNPPRYGVNWRCTMDVGIRVSNWLLAYDLFKSYGAIFDADFERIFSSSIYDHAHHIIHNLEYGDRFRSNHYLSDIAGLAMASLHLPGNKETNAWLAFCLQELICEMKHEFHEDGSNFEASTYYHRLSTEIIVYVSLFMLCLPSKRKDDIKRGNIKKLYTYPKLKSIQKQEYNLESDMIFPGWYWQRIEKALKFSIRLLKPDGTVPQFGDNDSGRFFKVDPIYTKMTVEEAKAKYLNLKNYKSDRFTIYYDENVLNQEHLKHVYEGLFNEEVLEENFETKLIRNFPFDKIFLNHIRVLNGKDDCRNKEIHTVIPSISNLERVSYVFSSRCDLLEDIRTYSYPGMGVYIFKSKYLYMAVRCGEIGQNGNGGHAHNDQLTVELTIDGKNIICDPGTYVYTPSPSCRNEFRSTSSHFTIQTIDNKEQNLWEDGINGLFSMRTNRTASKVLWLEKDKMIMSHQGFGDMVYRFIYINRNSVKIEDYGNNIKKWSSKKIISNGYGKVEKSTCMI